MMASFEKNQTKSKESKRGGARPNAGRKAGAVTKKTREIANKAMEAGITPLEVMLEAMNSFRSAGDLEKAAGFAKDAAPYMHAKLAAVEVTGKDGEAIETVTRIELVALGSRTS